MTKQATAATGRELHSCPRRDITRRARFPCNQTSNRSVVQLDSTRACARPRIGVFPPLSCFASRTLLLESRHVVLLEKGMLCSLLCFCCCRSRYRVWPYRSLPAVMLLVSLSPRIQSSTDLPSPRSHTACPHHSPSSTLTSRHRTTPLQQPAVCYHNLRALSVLPLPCSVHIASSVPRKPRSVPYPVDCAATDCFDCFDAARHRCRCSRVHPHPTPPRLIAAELERQLTANLPTALTAIVPPLTYLSPAAPPPALRRRG